MQESARRHRRVVTTVVAIVLVLAVAAAVVLTLVHRRHVTPALQVTTVRLQTMRRTIFSAGEVKPTERQLVDPTQLTSPVLHMDVSVGQHVKKGQILFQTDDSAQQQAISSAQSALTAANREYSQAQAGYSSAPDLLKQVWLPQVEAAEAAVTQAQQQLASAKAALAETQVRANFAGIVLVASPQGVDASGNQSPIVEVVGPQKQIVMELSEVDATHVKKGMSVSITSNAYPNQTFHGTVSMVAPFAATNQNGTGQVEVDVQPTGTFTVPLGYQVNCKIASATHKQVPTVPYGALVQQGSNYAVYVVSGGKAVLTPVQLGITNDTSVEVTSGLHAGEQILNNPPSDLQNGQAVKTS
ncbi:MexH family multidrug efflux RND transporter periplasmic adaptor subunit [Alicyclobacillus acidoterrestris]|uniref:efflux RND transporter periplasmic adaptor subunit n=1 Tax=Alicyclobacillus suci TaxID=2816080 RepID=UPI0011964825|nr:efflux RND transporter periplasmic adaptor subunit [Alicyclobacillus suci]GEO24368.1 MexH family multidrug efflux RND transporter periplasmic adaptor subunit [Alicyclobacillus acidoterrestris]